MQHFVVPPLQASRSGGVAGTDEEAGSPAAPVTITCPACRTLLPVPPGGVAHFQVRLGGGGGRREESDSSCYSVQ